jgi:hypothetical protein
LLTADVEEISLELESRASEGAVEEVVETVEESSPLGFLMCLRLVSWVIGLAVLLINAEVPCKASGLIEVLLVVGMMFSSPKLSTLSMILIWRRARRSK